MVKALQMHSSSYTLFVFMLVSLISNCTVMGAEIKGVVVEKSTSAPIAYSHVAWENGLTITDSLGRFSIFLEGDQPISLMVSHVGYQSAMLTIENPEEKQVIYLEKETIVLDEVIVYDAKTFIQNVIHDFHTNYLFEKHQHQARYKELISSFGDSILYLSGDFDVFVPSEVELSNQEIKALPISMEFYEFRPFNHKKLAMRGNVCDMSYTTIWRKDSFLDPDFIDHYEYYFYDEMKVNGRDQVVLEFSPSDAKGKAAGRIYVDKEDNAIVKLKYFPVNLPTEWASVTWEEVYAKSDVTYSLSHVTYDGRLLTKKNLYDYHAHLIIENTFESIQAPDSTFLYDKNYCFYYMPDFIDDDLNSSDLVTEKPSDQMFNQHCAITHDPSGL